jgi:hypothetical protein
MIQSAVQNSSEPIYLKPDPTTFEDAVANLMSFSDEGRQRQKFRNDPGAVQYTSVPRLRECFGWTRVSGEQLFSLPWKQRPACVTIDNLVREMRPDEDYMAIVYELVPKCRVPTAVYTIQAQLDFFWLVGFCFVPVMRTEEWFRFGLFMDMSDLVCPWQVGWSKIAYRRFVPGIDSTHNADRNGGIDSSIIAGAPLPHGGRHGPE